MFWTHRQWVQNTRNFEMDFEFRNKQFWCFKMDFTQLQWVISKWKQILKSKIIILKWNLESTVSHFKIELFSKSLVKFQNGFFTLHQGYNSQIWNGGLFEFNFFALELRFLNFRKWIRNLPYLELISFSLWNRMSKMFWFIGNHFKIR